MCFFVVVNTTLDEKERVRARESERSEREKETANCAFPAFRRPRKPAIFLFLRAHEPPSLSGRSRRPSLCRFLFETKRLRRKTRVSPPTKSEFPRTIDFERTSHRVSLSLRVAKTRESLFSTVHTKEGKRAPGVCAQCSPMVAPRAV